MGSGVSAFCSEQVMSMTRHGNSLFSRVENLALFSGKIACPHILSDVSTSNSPSEEMVMDTDPESAEAKIASASR